MSPTFYILVALSLIPTYQTGLHLMPSLKIPPQRAFLDSLLRISPLIDISLIPLLLDHYLFILCMKAKPTSDFPLSHSSLWLQNADDCVGQDRTPILCTSPDTMPDSHPDFLLSTDAFIP